MDARIRRIGTWIGGRLSPRIRILREGASLPPNALRRLKAAAFLVTGTALGAQAHGLSYQDALWRWTNENQPPGRTWELALLAYGLKAIPDGFVLHKALRASRLSTDEPGAVWVSENMEWVLVFSGPEDAGSSLPVRGFCSRCSAAPPARWMPMGRGWGGFGSVVGALENSPKPATKPLSRPDPGDPREIRY